MYIVEITEDKIDNLMEHVGKSMKCLHKVAECLEELKDNRSEEYDYDDEERRHSARYGGRYENEDGKLPHRGWNQGRYSRY